MSIYQHYRPPHPPSHIPSSQQICDLVTKEMRSVFYTHMHISLLLFVLQTFFAYMSSTVVVLISFASFCNIICLAERFWDLQLNSLVYWPPFCQCAFIISRLMLVTVGIITTLLWAHIGWAVVLEPYFNRMSPLFFMQ